ncbi:MAG: zinc ribbon domain-containing protein [Halobacteriales archaeon]
MRGVPLEGTYRFTCPECDEQVTVDVGIQELMLEEGCVVCDASVSAVDFEQLGRP